VNPVTTIQVGTYVSGVIQELSCDFNTLVHKDQLCAKIDPRPYEMLVAEDAAALATSRAQLAKDQANLDFATSVLERDKELLKNGFISQEMFDTADSAFRQARSQIALDQAAIKQREAELNAAKVNLGYTNIVSPVDGTVVSRNVTQGQTVAASFQTPTLFVIATDLTKMEVDTNVSESDIGAVRLGSEASFTVEAYPGRTFQGRVVQVRQSPQSVQNVVTYDVVSEAPNSDLLLKPGMTAAVRIVSARHDDVLRVPTQALRYSPASRAAERPAESRVWVLRDGKPVEVPVTIGLTDDSNAEITAGAVDVGDAVILSEHVAQTSRPASLPAQSMPRAPRL
jgi:HlyD family secretion protein